MGAYRAAAHAVTAGTACTAAGRSHAYADPEGNDGAANRRSPDHRSAFYSSADHCSADHCSADERAPGPLPLTETLPLTEALTFRQSGRSWSRAEMWACRDFPSAAMSTA